MTDGQLAIGLHRTVDVIDRTRSTPLTATEDGITRANMDAVRADPHWATVERRPGASPGFGERPGMPDGRADRRIVAAEICGEVPARPGPSTMTRGIDRPAGHHGDNVIEAVRRAVGVASGGGHIFPHQTAREACAQAPDPEMIGKVLDCTVALPEDGMIMNRATQNSNITRSAAGHAAVMAGGRILAAAPPFRIPER